MLNFTCLPSVFENRSSASGFLCTCCALILMSFSLPVSTPPITEKEMKEAFFFMRFSPNPNPNALVIVPDEVNYAANFNTVFFSACGKKNNLRRFFTATFNDGSERTAEFNALLLQTLMALNFKGEARAQADKLLYNFFYTCKTRRQKKFAYEKVIDGRLVYLKAEPTESGIVRIYAGIGPAGETLFR